jgi:DNA polymerase-3 subunit alpha
MKELIEYLGKNKIGFTGGSEDEITIDGELHLLHKPDEDGLLFNEQFMLMVNDESFPKYVYKFGGNWYFENLKDIEKPKMNELKYIGLSSSDISTENFLGVRGGYEILNGSSLYPDWVRKAKFLGVKCLGICEKNTLAGVLKFQLECQKNKIKPVIGATYTIFRESEDFKYCVKVYVKNEQGWNSILKLNKEVNVVNSKFVTENRLFECLDGLFIVVDPKEISFNKLNQKLRLKTDFYQLDTVEYVNNEQDKIYLENLKLFVNSKMNPVAITDAFYLDEEYSHIKKTLNSISGVREYESNNQYFKDKEDYFYELESLFNEQDTKVYDLYSKAMHNEKFIVDNCNFTVQLGARHLPKYEMTDEEKTKFETNEDLFWYLIEDGLKRKVSGDYEKYMDRIEKEFFVIEKGDVLDYFLILWDIIKYAKKNNILVGIGRGSAGGSLVCYFLDLIQLNPIEFDLLFERFINVGRIQKSLPDIDTDFPGTKREIIKKYMEERYGINQVCSVGTYTALQVKASIKDLGKQAGVDFDEINQVTTLIYDMKSLLELFYLCSDNKRVKGFVKKFPNIINDIKLVLHQPKAKSVHACAMLILPKEKDMFCWIPICKLGDQFVSEWEGVELESAGFLKEDILGIKQLDKFEEIIRLIKENSGKTIDIYKIPYDDQKVYDYFTKGWNEDVFHFGSRGLTGYCKELKPDNIEDLVAGISLYRPGAMENNFHNEYVLRREGKREVTYYTGSEEILEKTLGVFVYQEQIMKLCQVLGGLTLVEADDVRKAMVKKKYEELTKYKKRFITYYVSTFGVTQEYSEKVWDVIDKASTYLFNQSHATAYAITGYISQWFKVNYPIEYWSAAFKYSEETDHAKYISEINRIGDIKVMSIDINESRDQVRTNFETKTIYWPLISIKQCGEIASSQIMAIKDKDGQYFSFEEFLSRHKFKGSKVTKQIIENLIQCGAFDDIENIEYPSGRFRLIDTYRNINKVKVDGEKDIFSIYKDRLGEDWWWSLQQKKLSGISFFDYRDLVKRYIDSDYSQINIEDFQTESYSKDKKKVKIGGYITEIIERESKKGKWCRILLESNYIFVSVTIWAEQFKSFKNIDLQSKVKSLMLISGQIVWDSHKGENILQANEDTEYLILD